MNKNDRKNLIMSESMKLVVNKGLVNFSVKEVAELLKMNSVVIFRDFESRENLVYQCYISVRDEINAFLDNISVPPFVNQDEIAGLLNYIWYNFFQFLIKNGDHTLFYLAYVESLSRLDEGETSVTSTSVPSVFADLVKDDAKKSEMIFSYIMKNSLLFAKEVIMGRMENSEETCRFAGDLIFHGMKQYL